MIVHPLLIRQRISILYLDRGVLEQEGHGLVLVQGNDLTAIPVGRTAVLMLGPGVSVTHAAVRLCATEKTLLLWAGELGVRLYAAGNPHANAASLLKQCSIASNPALRLKAARKIYLQMFGEPAHPRYSIEQIRGVEGAKVKALYDELAKRHGVRWAGRDTGLTAPVNRALAGVNAALYGLTEAVILANGYSPSVGFTHSGNERSLVFDLADTVKFSTVAPLAFALTAEHGSHLTESHTRHACRDLFHSSRLVDRLFDNLQEIMDADVSH